MSLFFFVWHREIFSSQSDFLVSFLEDAIIGDHTRLTMVLRNTTYSNSAAQDILNKSNVCSAKKDFYLSSIHSSTRPGNAVGH